LQQDHRGIKQQYYPMCGFEGFEAAARFRTAQDELRDYFRYRPRVGETVPLAKRRQMFRDRWATLMTMLAA
jgi:putative transposase